MSEAGHEGHRDRLLSRFEENGIAALADYEIVELILTYVIPRKDTKPIAKALLKKYKTLSGLFHAEKSELSKVEGIGRRASSLFSLMREVTAYCLQEKFEKRSMLLHRKDVEEYLRFNFGLRGDEFVVVIFLDNGNNVIAAECICEGTVNQCAVYPRAVLEKALRCKAAFIILAHNHPGGGVSPSDADWTVTERLAKAGRLLEIPLLDHVIVTREKTMSLRDFPRWPAV